MCACNTGGGSDYVSPNETSLDEISSDQPWAHAADEEVSELRSCSATRTNERQRQSDRSLITEQAAAGRQEEDLQV